MGGANLLEDVEVGAARRLPKHTRRLSDKILIAFHHACDQRELVTARALLQVLEDVLGRPYETGDGRRQGFDGLVAAHERLWHLCHPDDRFR